MNFDRLCISYPFIMRQICDSLSLADVKNLERVFVGRTVKHVKEELLPYKIKQLTTKLWFNDKLEDRLHRLFGTCCPYYILNLPLHCNDKKRIRTSYYKMALRIHPDKRTIIERDIAHIEMAALNAVVNILNKSKKKSMYDRFGVFDEEDVSSDEEMWNIATRRK